MKIVILTGAGISKESGLDTFRDIGGVWSQVRLEDVATPEAFARDPDKVWAFYNARRRQLIGADVQPNAAHLALARLEADGRHDVLLVTQNVDDLHERAGSRNIRHMHGALLEGRCLDTGEVVEWRDDMDRDTISPVGGRKGGLRPNVVWFGEVPLHMEEIIDAIDDCDLFVSIGTSGNVYPAAGFVAEAAAAGADTLEINLEESAGARLFAQGRYGPASVEVPRWVDEVLAD